MGLLFQLFGVISEPQERKLTNKQKSDAREHLKKKQGRRCADCGVRKRSTKNRRAFDLDHKQPLAAGGKDNIKNMQLLCLDCHKQKTKREWDRGLYKKGA
ncbi:MAG: HNH endonuclease signature motif containing protein [Pseudomonadota bacterium]|nr:HNH endonuclease signature motif containing protein [Pseudomonadota bacterium]